MSRRLFALASLALLSAAAGCGRQPPEMADVSGTVTRNGKPLVGVVVAFDPEPKGGQTGERAEGLTDEVGRYRLRTAAFDRDGAAVGTYRVTVREVTKPTAPGGTRPAAAVPVEYTVPARTPLKGVSVGSGGQTYDIAVVPQAAARKK